MRKSEAVIEQIWTLREQGKSIRKISESLRISRNTVRGYLRRIPRGEIPLRREDEPGKPLRAEPAWVGTVDWETVITEYRSGVTAMQLYREAEPPVSYEQFTRKLRAKLPPPEPAAAASLRHEPGEKTQIDYCQGLELTDPRTGAKRKTQFFCGVLPFSSMTYGEFSLDQKLPTFIRSHEKMWAYFAGVTSYVVIDNLKAGVTRAHKYDPDVNPTYCDYGNHAGFAVLPARPRTPRDKAAVEAAIGAIQRDFFQRHRKTAFYSLDELNRAFRDYLDEFNARVMADHGVSRSQRFLKKKSLLQPCPSSRYELVQWKEAKVHPDCCIQVAKALYSVPYKFIGQTVKVKITELTITVLTRDLETIAFHMRQPDRGRSIVDEHRPIRTRQVASFDVEKATKQAEAVGPTAARCVTWQFDIDRPLQALRRVQGVIRLHMRGISPESMEFAAFQAMQFHRRDLRYFEQCALTSHVNGKRPRIAGAPSRDPSTLHLRGEN